MADFPTAPAGTGPIVLHRASEPDFIGRGQRCALCEAVLVTHLSWLMSTRDYFEPGALVTTGPGFVSAAKHPDAVPCTTGGDDG